MCRTQGFDMRDFFLSIFLYSMAICHCPSWRNPAHRLSSNLDEPSFFLPFCYAAWLFIHSLLPAGEDLRFWMFPSAVSVAF